MDILRELTRIINASHTGEDAAAKIIEWLSKKKECDLTRHIDNNSKLHRKLYNLVLERANDGHESIRYDMAISIAKDKIEQINPVETVESLLVLLDYSGFIKDLPLESRFKADLINLIENYGEYDPMLASIAFLNHLNKNNYLDIDYNWIESDPEYIELTKLL